MKSKTIPYFEVFAFTDRRFAGNPAGICLLEEFLPNEQLQAIATQNDLPETAFVVARGEYFDLRWLTPALEVDLCGHATLAAAHVLFKHRGYAREEIHFRTQSGELIVEQRGDRLVLDFPSRPLAEGGNIAAVTKSLGAKPEKVLHGRDYFAIFASAREVAAITPDFEAMTKLEAQGVVVTAPGDDCDFVSRYFAPAAGIPEDPVTGSTHCTLIPYWSQRLGKKELFARQISPRGGELFCEDRGDRVGIGGDAIQAPVEEALARAVRRNQREARATEGDRVLLIHKRAPDLLDDLPKYSDEMVFYATKIRHYVRPGLDPVQEMVKMEEFSNGKLTVYDQAELDKFQQNRYINEKAQTYEEIFQSPGQDHDFAGTTGEVPGGATRGGSAERGLDPGVDEETPRIPEVGGDQFQPRSIARGRILADEARRDRSYCGARDWAHGRIVSSPDPSKPLDLSHLKTGEPVTIEAFHGTPVGGKILDPGAKSLGERERRGKYLFTTTSKFYAKEYAMPDGSWWRKDYKPTIIRGLLPMKKPLVVDAEEGVHREVYPPLLKKMRAGGYDGLVVRNVADHPSFMAALGQNVFIKRGKFGAGRGEPAAEREFGFGDGELVTERDPNLRDVKSGIGTVADVIITADKSNWLQIKETPAAPDTSINQNFQPRGKKNWDKDGRYVGKLPRDGIGATPFVESSFVEQSGAFEFAKQAAGPAGSEAAANSAYEGNYVQLIDINPRMGGQPKDSSRVENQYAAPRLGITGSMMARESIMRSRLLGVKVRAGVGMRQLRWNPDTKRVEIQLTDRSWVRPRAVVLATGIKFTAMTQLGAKKHVINGNGMELLRRAGQGEAIVVGGGNSASQAAIAAAENGAHVTLISRSPLKKSMSDIPALAS